MGAIVVDHAAQLRGQAMNGFPTDTIKSLASKFTPFDHLAGRLLPGLDQASDGAHDVSHLVRVWRNAKAIQQREGGDLEILAAAALLHDCVAVEKDSPLRAKSSVLSAQRAQVILRAQGWDEVRIGQVAHAIESHSFSAGMQPATKEAKILQDADRLDAIGAIGIARCFYVAGRLGKSMYDVSDPRAVSRPLDDRQFAIDHFYEKLLVLASRFQTNTGAALAVRRSNHLESFLSILFDEIGEGD